MDTLVQIIVACNFHVYENMPPNTVVCAPYREYAHHAAQEAVAHKLNAQGGHLRVRGQHPLGGVSPRCRGSVGPAHSNTYAVLPTTGCKQQKYYNHTHCNTACNSP
jgi:hypothetical protein